jgi:hypothetical protein
VGLRPGVEAGVFVVDEEAAVFDFGLVVMRSGGEEEVGLVGGGDVGEPVPGGDANFLGDVVGTEDDAAAVGAEDEQGAGDVGERVIEGDLGVGFPLVFEVGRKGGGEFLEEGVEDRAVVKNGEDDEGAVGLGGVSEDGGGVAGDAVEVFGEAGGYVLQGGVGGGVEEDVGGVVVFD